MCTIKHTVQDMRHTEVGTCMYIYIYTYVHTALVGKRRLMQETLGSESFRITGFLLEAVYEQQSLSVEPYQGWT